VLLLVLILVLAAFGLLVVALVLASVTWAWLSVGVSVVAACALVVDWWQRQQVAKDEEEFLPPPSSVLPAAGEPVRGSSSVPPSEDEPVTEFIPVVPASDDHDPDRSAATLFIPQGVPDDSEQTVLLPQARPSGSVDQPPGASHPAPLLPRRQSRSVTATGSKEMPPPPSGGLGDWPGLADDASGDDPTVGPTGPGEDTNGVAASAGREAAQSSLPLPPDTPAVSTPAGSPPAASAPLGSAPTDGPHTPAVGNGWPGSGAAPGAPTDLPPAGPDGEPPEETVDDAVAAAVAGSQDEVVVVDERPRYHVGQCPFLPGRPVIALPVAEAVELGFSPCGWCTPVRVLDERRGATAH